MFTRILKSLVIAAFLGAVGCSNQAPNDTSAKSYNSIESETTSATTVNPQVAIEGDKEIETTLSDRRVNENGTEVRFSVTTDVAIEGQTEFVVALYVRELGDDRALAGYRIQNVSGETLWASEYAAKTTDMSWIQLKRTDGEHTWNLTVQSEDGISRQTHSMDDTRLVIESSLFNSGAAKLSTASEESMQQLSEFYAEKEDFINRKSDKFVISVLTDENLLLWVAGEPNDKIGSDDPQFVNGWGRLTCDILKAIHEAFCQKGTYETQGLCTILGVISAICEVLKKTGAI